MEDRVPFRVIRGSENNINQIGYKDGQVYFATDTKKIYLDAKNQRIPMGGNTGIYYGNANFDNMTGPEFFFNFTDIEGTNIPNVNDLILNSDGSFYKVIEIYLDTFEIKTEKLTIAGSGGGSVEPVGGSISVKLVPDSFHVYPYKTIISGSKCEIDFVFTAKDIEGNRTGNGRYEIVIDGVVKETGIVKQKVSEEEDDIINKVEIGKYFNALGQYAIQLNCYGYTGTAIEKSVSKRLWITTTAFEIKWPAGTNIEVIEKTINYLNRDFTLNWSVAGDLPNVVSHIVIDDTYTYETTEHKLLITSSDLNKMFKHGAHKCKIYATSGEVSTKEVVFNILFAEPENNEYIISCKFFQEKIKQYETIQIPVMIWSPVNTQGDATIIFNVNTQEKATKKNCTNLTWYSFAFTPGEPGLIPIEFVCNNTTLSLLLDVEAIELNINEVPDYIFKFKATDFSNNEEIINTKIVDGKSIIFSENFDWINGGLQTGIDDVGPYFKIPAGSYMTIPYNLFNRNIQPTIGANFKIIFKASNCQDYDAIIAENIFEEKGLRLTAQGAKITDGTKVSELRYCEDSYLEYEYDYIYDANSKARQYLVSWMDGVPSRVVQTDSSSFTAAINDVYLTIGSVDCDVFIYLIKFYARHLTNDEHLNNFIMDAPNPTEISARYTRNNIYSTDTYGNKFLDYKLLVQNNPDCNVYIYEIPKIPTSKKDVTDASGNSECCTFTHYLANTETPINYFNRVKLRAQGTSSMAYGLSAYNLDSKFPESWAMDEKAIPINYYNTKVNVASCEGANNALNQEWYNRWQPYKTRKRLQIRTDGKEARDTMQFKPGVLFLIDKNQVVNDETSFTNNNVFKEIPGYVEKPYARLYSICNMGNSKKNTEVFHGAGNEFECCVEVADNNTAAQQMVTIGGYYEKQISETETITIEVPLNLPDELFDSITGEVIEGIDWGETLIEATGETISNKVLWENAMNKLFEFRYIPNKDDEELFYKCSCKFLRLVNWFAKNNPANYLSEAEIEGLKEEERIAKQLNPNGSMVELPSYKIKGVRASGANTNYPEEYEVLKGQTIPAESFKYDSKEYRAAKMLRECENYLILDSVVYHYLFIERHTMSDNVAKNTFWNTEDGIHWELTKNYDNDTADGVDNNGDLTFDYGYEILDKGNNGQSVFNASNSAWLLFIYYMPATIKRYMYKHLAAKGAWSIEAYLSLFRDEWQNLIPEACWIEDFYRKFFRPYEVYNNASYLSRLANGKKEHQRKQYETYQGQFIDSKYQNISSSDNIEWRAFDDKTYNESTTIYYNVTLYADGYVVGALANGHNPNIYARAKKGQTIPIAYTIQANTALNDATGYLYFPNLFTKIENFENMKPSKLDISKSNKIKLIQLDASTNNSENLLFSSEESNRFTINNNLQSLIMKNCKNITFGLDLSNCSRLTNVDLTGSTFTGFTAANAPVSQILLESPVSLTLNNLYYLTQETFNIKNYSRLTQINLNNIDFDINSNITKNISKVIINNIIQHIGDSLLTYKLTNVGWDFDSKDNITDNSIPLLDILLNQSPNNALDSKAQALTGFGNISEEAYNGENSLNLYEKYGLYSSTDNSYPYFILNFQGNNAKLNTISILDGNGKEVWSRQIENYNSISNNILANGVQGIFNVEDALLKRPSTTEIFTFANSWRYTFEDGSTGIIAGEEEGEYKYLDLAKLASVTGSGNIIIEPVYTSETYYYTIYFQYADQTTPFYTASGLEYGDSFANVKPKIVPIKDDSNLSFDKTYRLKGYTGSATSTSLINEDSWVVTKDKVILYPVFEEVNIRKADFREYLNIKEEQRTIDGIKKYYKVLYGINQEDGNYVYQGNKIIIPAEVEIIGSNAFKSTSIKYIFVENNSALFQIDQYSFNTSELKYFDFENCTNLKSINTEAFRTAKLDGQYYTDGIIKLPNGLKSIGSGAFNDTISSSAEIKFYIPASVSSMGQYAVANWDGAMASCTIYIGEEGDFSQLELKYSPTITFNQNGKPPAVYVNFYTQRYTKEEIDENKYIQKITDLSVINS